MKGTGIGTMTYGSLGAGTCRAVRELPDWEENDF